MTRSQNISANEGTNSAMTSKREQPSFTIITKFIPLLDNSTIGQPAVMEAENSNVDKLKKEKSVDGLLGMFLRLN
jgi:hypothetical protein